MTKGLILELVSVRIVFDGFYVGYLTKSS